MNGSWGARRSFSRPRGTRDDGPGDRRARGSDQARPVLLLPQQGRDLPRPDAAALQGVHRASIESAAREKGTSRERITRLCLHSYDDFIREPPIARILYSFYYGPPQGAPHIDFDAVHLRFQESVIRLLREGIRDGEFRRGDPADTMWAVAGAVNVAMELELCRPGQSIGRGGSCGCWGSSSTGSPGAGAGRRERGRRDERAEASRGGAAAPAGRGGGVLWGRKRGGQGVRGGEARRPGGNGAGVGGRRGGGDRRRRRPLARYQAEIKSEYGGIVSKVYVHDWARVRKGDPLFKVDTREGEVAPPEGEGGPGNGEGRPARGRGGGEPGRPGVRPGGEAPGGGADHPAGDGRRADAEGGGGRPDRGGEGAGRWRRGRTSRRSSTRLGKAVVRAPFDGTVSERLVNAGDLVGEMQKVVFRVVDNRTARAHRERPVHGDGCPARRDSRCGSPPTRFRAGSSAGRITWINPSVSPGDRSVRVIAEVPNEPEVLKGGLFVKGRIVTGGRKGVVLVPRAAL